MIFKKHILLIAFAFTVMADPVSSVAYAIEAALHSLHGNVMLLLPTMALVVGIVGLIIINYHQLIARFPDGGGAAAAAGKAFGEPWAFIPIGALVVDFVLTIAISVSAGASAVIAYFPSLASSRIIIALALLILVAWLTWFGHIGRIIFASATLAFIAVCALVIAGAIGHDPISTSHYTNTAPLQPAFIAIMLSFPVAMALATGVEAPASAIAELGQLKQAGKRRFGQITIWLTLIIVGTLTLGLAFAATKFSIHGPSETSTLIADIARISVSHNIFAAFQLATALLLLAAASSSFQAGPGLFKALARTKKHHQKAIGILPHALGKTNKYYTPFISVLVFLVISAIAVIFAGGYDQKLVLFYAVSVFMSFLIGLVAMSYFSWKEKKRVGFGLNTIGALIVGFTLAVNLARIDPIASLVAALIIAFFLYCMWLRAGKPHGISQAHKRA